MTEPPPDHDTYLRDYEESQRALRERLAAKLDRRPFGERLARRLWRELERCAQDEGLIHEKHRDYCGHGLIRSGGGVMLCEIQDGYFPGPAIARWPDQEAFVAFFARQSDWSCSGWEPAEPVFYTDDPWRRSNQRLTRAVIRRFLPLW
jgi:hypothetical protein